jgi:4-oxalocrotonate tautomerase
MVERIFCSAALLWASNASDDLVILQVTVSNTRTVEQKKALFARIAELLSRGPGLRREDAFINLVEVVKENWSFGNGIAQYAD